MRKEVNTTRVTGAIVIAALLGAYGWAWKTHGKDVKQDTEIAHHEAQIQKQTQILEAVKDVQVRQQAIEDERARQRAEAERGRQQQIMERLLERLEAVEERTGE
jgi:hypothetical protein